MADQFKATIEDFEADDIRAFYDSHVLRVWHLSGKERTFRIARVQRITKEFRGEVIKRALLRLLDSKGRTVPLPLELNPTNRNAISRLYGLKPSEWPGKFITLYPTTTESPTGTVDCIRIRNQVPGTGVAPRKNKNGVHVIKAEPEPLPAIATRQPGDDSEEDDSEDSEEPAIGELASDVLRADDVIQ
jgi:hypothetical protein